MLYVIGFLIVISIIVLVHEAGHFFMARLMGVKVEEFAFGMGKEVVGYTSKKSGVRYKICRWPIGGYVKMFGDEDASSQKADKKKIKKLSAKEKKQVYHNQPVWKKILIAFAGPFTNYLFAFIILAVVLFIVGVQDTPAIVCNCMEESPAKSAGILPGDKVIGVAGKKVSNFKDIKKAILMSTGDIVVKVERGNQIVTLTVTPEGEGENRKIGAYFVAGDATSVKKLSVGGAIKESYTMIKDLTVDTLVFVGQMISGKRSADGLSGPIGIAEASGNALKSGILGFVLFIAHISVGIGLINLFPIPILDGGQILIFAIEGVTRRKLSDRVINVLFYIGFGLLILLMVFAFWLDISRIIGRIFN